MSELWPYFLGGVALGGGGGGAFSDFHAFRFKNYRTICPDIGRRRPTMMVC